LLGTNSSVGVNFSVGSKICFKNSPALQEVVRAAAPPQETHALRPQHRPTVLLRDLRGLLQDQDRLPGVHFMNFHFDLIVFGQF
jgi:hypothetical protein